eukprot:1802583-Prymnesium_polylepis.2
MGGAGRFWEGCAPTLLAPPPLHTTTTTAHHLLPLAAQVVPSDVHAMVRHMDADGDGLVSFDEWRRALGSSGDDDDGSEELDDEPGDDEP